MSYSAKHKANSRYGVIDDDGNWLDDFLGTKQEGQAKANELNFVNGSKEVKEKKSENQTRARAFYIN